MAETLDETVNAAEAIVERRSRFSIVWLVPIVAILIGAWLVYKAQSEKGPTVSISFVAAEGVVAGKTKVKYKDVIVGEVDSVQLAPELESVAITATLHKELESYLTDKTQFWVARPRLTGTHLSGLDTILSGSYVAIEPSKQGAPQLEFVGLDTPPVVSADTPGRRLVLETERLGSLGVGSPLYYRQLPAGEVEEYELNPDGGGLEVKIFVNHPFDKLVNQNSRFWNASGIRASMSADGIEVRTESLVAILAGGIEFDSPDTIQNTKPVDDGHRFKLYPDRQTATGPISYHKEKLLLYFEGSLRGLTVGAPVEIRGIKIGEVIDFKLLSDFDAMEMFLPVLIEYEPQRIGVIGGERAVELESRRKQYSELVELGLRAQLKTGSILTGQLYVDIDFHPNAEPAEVTVEDGVVVFPTVPGHLEALRADVTTVLKRLQAIPVEEIANNLKDTLAGTKRIANSPELSQSLASLNQALAHTKEITDRINTDAVPELNATLREARRSLTLAQQNVLRQDSAIYHEMTRALEELSAAARSIRVMADYLERHPDALLKGKRGTR